MPTINVNDAYVLNETGAQVDAVTDIPFKADAGLTDAQKEQARKNIAAGGTNPNLLDNPFFQVNQRGQSTYSSGTVCVDRWKCVIGGSAQIDVVAGGITYRKTASDANYNGIQQVFESTTGIQGKTVTFSVLVNGTVYSTTFDFPLAGNDLTGIGNMVIDGVTWQTRVYHTGATHYIYFRNLYNGTFSVTFTAAKLELGSVSTLANDAPPNYAEELAKCQRYFLKLTDVAYPCMCGANPAVVGVPVPTPVTMPDNVQIQSASVGWIRGGGNNYSSSASANNMTPRPKPNTVAIDITHGVSGLSTMTIYWINFSQLVFSADL